jgi:hypothetical protein
MHSGDLHELRWCTTLFLALTLGAAKSVAQDGGSAQALVCPDTTSVQVDSLSARGVAARELMSLAADMAALADSAQGVLARYVGTLGMGYEGRTGLYLVSARDLLETSLRLNPWVPGRWVRIGLLEWKLADLGAGEFREDGAKQAAKFARCGRLLSGYLGVPAAGAEADSLLSRIPEP